MKLNSKTGFIAVAILSLAAECTAANMDSSKLPASGIYTFTDQNVERTLTIKSNGQFELFGLERGGKPGHVHSATGEGSLHASPAGWIYESVPGAQACTMTVMAQAADQLQVNVTHCASDWGDLSLSGTYRIKAGSSKNANKLPKRNDKLQAQLNCQNLDLSEQGIAKLLTQANSITSQQVWEHEVPIAEQYNFGGLPIQSVYLSETDNGSLSIFVNADRTNLQNALSKSKKGAKSTAILKEVGKEPDTEIFLKQHPRGQAYIKCQPANAGY